MASMTFLLALAQSLLRLFSPHQDLSGHILTSVIRFLASQDALEVMLFTYSLTDLLMVSIDLTDVTLVSDDT